MGRAPLWGCYPQDLEEFQYLLRIRRRRPDLGCFSSLARVYMPEGLRNQRRGFDTGEDPQSSTAIGAGLDVNSSKE